MIQGLTEGRWALLTKIHHCMVDGIAATELVEALMDRPSEEALSAGVVDPLGRLQAVQVAMQRLKASGEAVASAAVIQASGWAPPVLLAPGMRLASTLVDRIGQRHVTTVVTNVPGPQHAFHVLGRRVIEWFPYVPIAEGVRIGVAALSYDGGIRFGVTGGHVSRLGSPGRDVCPPHPRAYPVRV